MSTCNNESCGTSSKGGCGSSNCGCTKKSDCDTGCSVTNKMVMLADRAWEQAVVERMKKLWEDQMGDKLDEIAVAAVETSGAIHMNKMKGMTAVKEGANKIQAAFS